MRNISLILLLLVAGIFNTKSLAQAVILKADTVEVPCNSLDTFSVPIRLDNFSNIAGLQFTLMWDTARLDYAFITGMNPQFSGVGFDTSATTIAQGKLTFAWTDLAGVSLPNDAILFEIAFARIGGPQTPVMFVNVPTDIAVFDDQFNEVLSETQDGAVVPLDTVGPSLTCPANVVTGGSGPTAVPNIPPIVSDDCSSPNVGWSSVGATIANFPSDPDASSAVFNIGSSIVTYTATDVGGNTATCAFEVTVEFSISSTDLTLVANAAGAVSCGDSVSIDVLAFNFDSIAGLQFSMEWLPAALEYLSITNLNPQLSIDISNFGTSETANGLLSFAWTSSSLSGSTVPDGEVLFTLNFNALGATILNFGNNPTAALAFTGTIFPPEEVPLDLFGATVVVVDTVPPSITCPADITVQAPSTTAVQGISPLSVDDNCSAPFVGWSVTGATIGNFPNDPDASGGLFNIGSSTVTYNVTDAGGNTASCSFNVTVEFAINTTDLTIIANSVNVSCGGSFSIDFTALNFETVAGIQFTVNWDPALFQYTSVDNFNVPIGIGVANFGVADVSNGSITFAWTSGDLNGSTINNGDVLFTLNFDLLGNSSSTILFGDVPTVRLAFDGGTFDEIPMMTIDGLVSVADNVPPTITCPGNVMIDAPQGQLFASVTGLDPVALSDNCGGTPSLSYAQTGATTNSGTSNADGNYNAGTTTVTYTATDDSGNTATCSFQVVVDAGTPLILHVDSVDLGCQAAIEITICVTVENFSDVKFAHFWVNWDTSVIQLTGVGNFAPGLNINNTMFFNFPDTASGLLKFFGGNQTWPDLPNGTPLYCLTFNVVDAGAFPTTITFSGPIEAVNSNFENVPVLTVDGVLSASADNVPPVVTCPPDTIVNALPLECTAEYIPVAPTAMDACGTIASTVVSPDTTMFEANIPTVLTYTVTDGAGNSATCSFTVTVFEDNPPQVFNCPPNITVDAGNNCMQTATWTPPTFQDVCQGTLVITNDYDPGDLFTIGNTLVNYTAMDNSNNVVTCSFEVTVRDTLPPSLVCPPDTVVTPIDGCSAVVNFAAPIASDNCDVNLSVICSDTSGTVFSGINSVTCTTTDNAGNVAICSFTITVNDAIAPTFPNGCPPDINVISASGNCGANPSWQAPLASDNCDQNLSVVASNMPGSFFDVQNSPHTVTYTATDDLGNTATCTFTVTVADNTNPVLTNCPTLPIIIVLPTDKCDTVLTWTPPTVSDNCGIGGVLLISNIPSGATFTTGDTMVVYTATDASGNSSTCFFNVSVKDVVPPVLTGCPTQPIVIQNGTPCGVPVDFPFPTGMDNCTPDSSLVFTSIYLPGDTFPVGINTFKVRVIDASGNFDECDITVTVVGQSPGFINVPANINVNDCDTEVSWIEPTAVGFCPPIAISVSPLSSGSIFPFGVTTVTYMASDTIGNTATATFTVTVMEDVEPVFDCPVSPIVVSVAGVVLIDQSGFILDADTTAGCAGVELTFDFPNATDNCVTPTVTQLQGGLSGSVFPIGFSDLIFRAVDSSGNLSQCAVFIEVVALPQLDPTVDPNPGCAGEDIVITAINIPGAIYTWQGPVTSTTNMVMIDNLSLQNDGDYIVSANINGCQTPPDTATVYLTQQPTAMNDLDYTINPGETATFPSVLLNDQLSPAFDFGVCDTSALPGLMMNFADGTFTYTAGQEPGMVSFTYKVCSRSCDLEDQAAVTITINDTKCVFIPNIITPNGDDVNDWFTIPCIETGLFRDNSLVVYNQWGDKVYEAKPYSNDPDEAWRGTLDGKPGKDLPDGVYFYIFKPGPNIPPMKGFVEIFR